MFNLYSKVNVLSILHHVNIVERILAGTEKLLKFNGGKK